MDTLDVSQCHNLINIVTGKISNKNVNVEETVQIGEFQLQEFESACPTGFYQTIKRTVITMKEGTKQRGVDPMEQCDSGLIFARVKALMSTRANNLNDVLKYELAAVLTSIFDEKSGELRISKSKSILKRRLQVEVTNPSRGTGDAVVIGGCAILWVLQWPSKGLIKDVVLIFVNYATNKRHCYRRTRVIFDRYNTSIKDATRCQRACEAATEYKLTVNASLPQQQVVLSVTKNKVQLIDLMCEELQQLDDVSLNTSLVITGRFPVPIEVRSDALVQLFDLKTTHEEADVIIPKQVVELADMGCKTINVICDDTYVFVLLAHYFAEESLTVSLIMESTSTSRSRSSIDIGATVAKHSGIVPQLIAAHALSRCDTVGCYHGIGKTKVVKALSAGIELNHSGDPKASLDDVMKESTHFIGACYGQK